MDNRGKVPVSFRKNGIIWDERPKIKRGICPWGLDQVKTETMGTEDWPKVLVEHVGLPSHDHAELKPQLLEVVKHLHAIHCDHLASVHMSFLTFLPSACLACDDLRW